MDMIEYEKLVQNAKVATDSKALADTFDGLIQEMQYYMGNPDWDAYVDDEKEGETTKAKRKRLCQDYLRGLRMVGYFNTLVQNPIYTIIQDKRPMRGENFDRNTGLGYYYYFLYTSEKAAQKRIEENKLIYGADRFRRVKIVRVPFFAMCEYIIGEYLDEQDELDEGHNILVHIPFYEIGIEDGDSVKRMHFPITFFNLAFPGTVVGAFDKNTADVILGNGREYVMAVMDREDEEVERGNQTKHETSDECYVGDDKEIMEGYIEREKGTPASLVDMDDFMDAPTDYHGKKLPMS